MVVNFEELYRQAEDEADRLFVQLHSALEQINQAREEGRQEVRDAIIAQMDIYAPHAVEWWKQFNEILEFDPKGR